MTSILAALRELPSMVRANQLENAQNFAFSAVQGGLPKGALVEVSGLAGSGKTELVLKFLAENPEAKVAWIEENFTIYPVAFPRAQVKLDRVLFVDATPGSSEALWAAHQALKAGVFQVVVLTAVEADEMALRRLQLVAEKSGVTIILLNEEVTEKGSWPLAVQIEVVREQGSPTPHILKYRGRNVWHPQSASESFAF